MTLRIAAMALTLGIAATVPASVSNATAASMLPPPNKTVEITVPVHLSQIPSGLPTARVICTFRYVGQPSAVGNGSEYGGAVVPLVNGAFNGNVKLTLTLDQTPASQVNGYQCDLYLYPNAGNAVKPDPNSPNIEARPQPGTLFVAHVEGAL